MFCRARERRRRNYFRLEGGGGEGQRVIFHRRSSFPVPVRPLTFRKIFFGCHRQRGPIRRGVELHSSTLLEATWSPSYDGTSRDDDDDDDETPSRELRPAWWMCVVAIQMAAATAVVPLFLPRSFYIQRVNIVSKSCCWARWYLCLHYVNTSCTASKKNPVLKDSISYTCVWHHLLCAVIKIGISLETITKKSFCWREIWNGSLKERREEETILYRPAVFTSGRWGQCGRKGQAVEMGWGGGGPCVVAETLLMVHLKLTVNGFFSLLRNPPSLLVREGRAQ